MTATYEIGPFRLDPKARVLAHGEVPVQLGPRAVAVLMVLVERAREFVAKEHILDTAWPGVVVEEANLAVQISAIRRALGRASGGDRWIETLPKRGYRFVGPVTERREPRAQADKQGARSNLPRPLTSFIGRECAVSDVERLLGGPRLLTMIGIGGIGKTRLALEVAARAVDGYPDGAWFVDLAPIADGQGVVDAVARVLEIREEAGKPLRETLSERLRAWRTLLVFDNCEHLLDSCARLADALLRQCPGVRILATSREALGIAGEQTYRVPSLSLPDRKQVQTPQTLAAYESVQLFIDRALLVRPEFEVTGQNAPALAGICWHLDGIPLAIEMAAARVRVLAVEEIEGMMAQRFRLLNGGSRTALPRHQTLRSLIDWSYDLLRDPEQILLQRLSVFVGGWTLAAAEAVCAGDSVAGGGVLDLLTSLCDKSLVVAEQPGGHSRYRLLETVQQYACERLTERGEREAVCKRHRDFYLALAEHAESKLWGAEQAVWLRRLEEDYENLLAGLTWSLAEARPEGALRLCGALGRFWRARGHQAQGLEWCGRTLRKEGGKERIPERAKVLQTAGALAYEQGDYPAATARFEESLAIMRELGDGDGIARMLGNLGNLAADQGDFAGARALHEESLALARENGNRRGIAISLQNLGNLALAQSDLASARGLYEESLAIMRELGNSWGIANSLFALGVVARGQGDLAAARALGEESLAIMRELGYRLGIAFSLTGLGDVVGDQGEPAAARALYDESLAIMRELGNRYGIARALTGLGAVSGDQGDLAAARALHKESLALMREIGDREGIARSLNSLGHAMSAQSDFAPASALYEESLVIMRELGERRVIADSLAGLAEVSASLRNMLRAARLWGAAARLREEVGSPLPPRERSRHDQRVAAARADFGDDAAFDQIWQVGHALTLEQAIDFALVPSAERR